MIKREKPNLVTLDIRMPGEDGLIIHREIREAGHDLPVIMCSTFSTVNSNFCIVAADHYFVKSSKLGELKKKIKEVLDKQDY